jgi:hypothetical protein
MPGSEPSAVKPLAIIAFIVVSEVANSSRPEISELADALERNTEALLEGGEDGQPWPPDEAAIPTPLRDLRRIVHTGEWHEARLQHAPQLSRH